MEPSSYEVVSGPMVVPIASREIIPIDDLGDHAVEDQDIALYL